MSTLISNDFEMIKLWMQERGLAQETQLESMCHVEDCGVYMEESYAWCQGCENFSICDKQDEAHETALVYFEGCKETHFDTISVCLFCVSKKPKFNKCGCPSWYLDIFNKYEVHKQR